MDDKVFIHPNFRGNNAGMDDKGAELKIHMNISSTSPGSGLSVQNSIPAKPRPAPSEQSQDTVQLSTKAQALAAGDVDHDGDSH